MTRREIVLQYKDAERRRCSLSLDILSCIVAVAAIDPRVK